MIIIDSDNYAENGIQTFFFPGGEPHAKVPQFDEAPVLFLKLRTWNDVGTALAVLDAIDQQGVFHTCFVPYFPGARQDRSDGKSPLTVELMSRIIPLCGVDAVFDPHSDAVTKLTGAQVFMPKDLPIPVRKDVVGIIAPDAGAQDRALQFRNTFYPDTPVIICAKKRDFATGKFIGYSMPELSSIGHYIVVDDICDGGGTFNLLADQFDTDPYGCRSTLELFVSHGIFSKGLNAISRKYERITTTDSWCSPVSHADPRLTVIPLWPSLKEYFGA